MMFDLYFIITILIFALLCFLEFIVFNEEILLTICFLSFVFYCFNALSNTIVEAFDSRNSKFEFELLTSFQLTKQSINDNFTSFSKFRRFFPKFELLLISILAFISFFKNFFTKQIVITITNVLLVKLNELVLIQNRLTTNFQNNFILNLLYPLVLKTIEYDFLLNSTKSVKISSNSKVLKTLS